MGFFFADIYWLRSSWPKFNFWTFLAPIFSNILHKANSHLGTHPEKVHLLFHAKSPTQSPFSNACIRLKAHQHRRWIGIHPEWSKRIAIEMCDNSSTRFGMNSNSSPVWKPLTPPLHVLFLSKRLDWDSYRDSPRNAPHTIPHRVSKPRAYFQMAVSVYISVTSVLFLIKSIDWDTLPCSQKRSLPCSTLSFQTHFQMSVLV